MYFQEIILNNYQGNFGIPNGNIYVANEHQVHQILTNVSISRNIDYESTILIQHIVVIGSVSSTLSVLSENIGSNDVLHHPTFVGTNVITC